MRYFKKIFLIFFFPILVFGCGYEPIYKDISNLNFSIILNNVSGDDKINRLIKSKLKNYNYNEKEFKKYNVNIISDYKKTTISKDATGKATDYEISVKIKFNVSFANYEKDFSYSESFNETELNLQKAIKETFDPKHILNPSKIFV